MSTMIKDYNDKVYLILSKEEIELLKLKKGWNGCIHVISKEDCYKLFINYKGKKY